MYLGTARNTAGTMCPACSLLSHDIDDSLGSFSVIMSVTHGRDVIIPGNPIFSQMFSPKILWELLLLRFLVIPAVIPDTGNCPNSALTGLEAIHPYFCNYALLSLESYCCS